MSSDDRPAPSGGAATRGARVADAMRHAVVACSADTTVRAAASIMARHHVHALVVNDAGGSPAGLLTDRALLDGLLDAHGADRAVADLAESDPCTVSSDDTVADAARVMRERGVSHLLVRDARSGRLTGMLSTLDVAGILAGPAD